MVPTRSLPVAGLIALLAALPAPATAARKAPRALQAFDSCEQLVGYAKRHAVRAVRAGWVPTPDAFMGAGRPMPVSTAKGPIPPQAAMEDGASSGAGGSGQPFSTTNVQEQGVDEPDAVKTNGDTLFAVQNGVLNAIDVRGETPILLDELKLDEGYGHELLLRGDTVLVLQTAWLQQEGEPYGRTVTRMTEVDVSDPADLRAVRHERADGEYVSARMTGGTVRVVLASRAPVLYDVGVAGSEPARVRRVRRASLAAWRPHSFFRVDGRPKKARLRVLTRCGEVRHTQRFSGLDTVTILTVDLDRGLPSVDADAVMSDGQIVYASPTRLYVATQRWLSPAAMDSAEPPAITTQIHQFDTSDPDSTTYVGSGTVSGYLLNQFAMSEHEGALRVAATEEPQWWPRGGEPGTGSAVTTLDAGTMAQRGRVGGLGKGERIYAVRFLGDRGYVVTFRQVDPLYVLDLSDADAPKVTGELKIAGYSAYLHPVGVELLLGVGQDAGADGRTTGTQLSLFDVSDPAAPQRIAQYAVGSHASSTAEWDHHAFLWWPQTDLAVLPLSLYDWESDAPPFVGAIGLRVKRDGITEVGRIQHPADGDYLWDIQRATVVGERLFTLSPAGLLSSGLSDLSTGPFLPFPSKPPVYSGGCGDVAVDNSSSSSSDAAVSCVPPQPAAEPAPPDAPASSPAKPAG